MICMNMTMDAMEFFQLSAGRWRSLRTTHHLAFKQVETGEAEIEVDVLDKNDTTIIELCKFHQLESKLALGGAFVSWKGGMAWDKKDENHEGSTVFALIPDTEPRQGKLLRDQGYADSAPVVGQYFMDQQDALVLVTDYDTMTINERFWFGNQNLRFRTSTVQLLGGFTTATFTTEIRMSESN